MDKSIVSTQEIFPLIHEVLDQGKKVKFMVSGTSMLPWIGDNKDQVLVTGIQSQVPKVGDIVLFRDKSGEYILHRIIKKTKGSYLTMGDACYRTDGFVNQSMLIGVVEAIYKKNHVINCSSTLWKIIFYLWRKAFRIRKVLMKFYYSMVWATGLPTVLWKRWGKL